MSKLKDFWIKLKTKAPNFLSLPVLLMLLVVVLFTVVIIWSEPIANLLVTPTTTSNALLKVTPTMAGVATGLPTEVLETPVQTNGILFGAVVLVLIIIISTVARSIPKKEKTSMK